MPSVTGRIITCIVCAGVLSRRLAYWLMDSVYSRRSFCGLFGTATVKEMFFFDSEQNDVKDDMQRFFTKLMQKVVSSCLLQYKPVCVINFD